MSLSKYESTQETTNFARVARIILGPCTDVLRAVLAKEITPLNLIKAFNACIAQNKKLPLSQEQEQLIYGGNYLEFDITLLYVLFRNVSSIPPHATQWGNNPNLSDRSVSANIERIRIKRNHYLHIKHPSISKSDFEQEWKQMFQIVKELEHYLGPSTDFQDAMTAIKKCSMDPGVEQSYTQKLRIVENLQVVVNTLDGKKPVKDFNLNIYTFLE